ncbi:hypothetical protein BJ322DRAFT_1176818 [Thelephora terrestris]|uniref:Uncharacterized protein n=1 Tax=Thelephora terrestris TaxID=56493 RepID=A0A9P6H499_9AGAM|nr:hypothetical protein BJ322DRAFT_1176818 [Thelephora terrestris]
MAAAGTLVGIYNCLINDVKLHEKSPWSGGPGQPDPSDSFHPIQLFMDSSVIDIFTYRSGKDITQMPDSLNIDSNTLARQKCQFTTHILLALSIVMVSVIESKFLALESGSRTEEENGLKTIDSLSNLRYDDKRKLLFIICNGMIWERWSDSDRPRYSQRQHQQGP